MQSRECNKENHPTLNQLFDIVGIYAGIKGNEEAN